jgi:hypothetical protein
MMRLVVVVPFIASCVTWTAPTSQVKRPSIGEPVIELRRDQLPGNGQLLADGSFRFQVDLARVCRRSEISKEVVVTVEEKELAFPGQASIVVGAAAIVIGSIIAATGSGDSMPGSGGSAAMGGSMIVVGLPLVGVPLYYRYFRPPNRRETVITERDVPATSVEVPCDNFAPVQTLGELEVITPWGARQRAALGTDGSVQVAIDWAMTGLDPRAPDIAARLGMPWKVRSTRTGLATDWVPQIADRDLQMKKLQIASAATAGEPPEVSVLQMNADNGALVAGQRNTIRLTVENRGGGVARKLVAKARSAHKAIDDKVFEFGDIGAGETRTRAIDFELPANEPATMIMVVAEFSLEKHLAPPNATARLTVTPRLCPEQKLTRAEYDAKRAKLQKLVKDGLLEPEQFERYDAILLGCRK